MAATVGLDRDSSFPKASFSLASSSPPPCRGRQRLLDIGAGAERLARARRNDRVDSVFPSSSSRASIRRSISSVTRLSGGLLRVIFATPCESLYEDEPALSGARQGQITPATIARGLGGSEQRNDHEEHHVDRQRLDQSPREGHLREGGRQEQGQTVR